MTELKSKKDVGSYHLEMDKGRAFSVASFGEVRRINELSEERIELVSRGGVISVSGQRLSLTLLEFRSCEINGRIEKIEFLGKQRGALK